MNKWLKRGLVGGLLLSTAAVTAQGAGRLEIFSWWTTGGEAAGLLKLFDIFKAQHPGVTVINDAVAGGAGTNARAVLKTRMLGGNPPDSFQVHMGKALVDTWVTTKFMQPLDSLYAQEGWTKVFPKDVLALLKYDGHYWAVPADIHRANMVWYNKKVFKDNDLKVPTTWAQFFQVAAKLKDKGITPLALGDNGIWASTMIFESTLISELGPQGYDGLWNGTTPWNSPKVTAALSTMAKVLNYVNSDHAARSWDQANNLVISGKAAMTLMGDWVPGDYQAKKFTGYGWAPAPGNAGVYDVLSDSFGLPKGAPDPKLAMDWLKLLGSKQGQDAFNPLKGSICARTDCDASLFGPYQQWAMKKWKTDAIVPSLAHGAAASPPWLTSINDVMTIFVTSKNVSQAQNQLIQAAKSAGY